jgi:23S rRNA pseudouridine1911/1915/1917 synthase
MPAPPYIELGRGKSRIQIPILYEDRSVIAIDKPSGWLVAPADWDRTSRNLQRAIEESIVRRSFWVKSRNLKFLRFVHRLDAQTTGVLLLVKSRRAVKPYSELFERKRVLKLYLAVVQGLVEEDQWICALPLKEITKPCPRVIVDLKQGKPATTQFYKLAHWTHPGLGPLSLVAAIPETGRTHQIRVHLASSGHPLVGDSLYGGNQTHTLASFGLRSVALKYRDPFTHQMVSITAPVVEFLRQFGLQTIPEMLMDLLVALVKLAPVGKTE